MLEEKKRVAIIGLGVIGGSLGMALQAKGNYEVTGIDRDPSAVRLARKIGAVSLGTTDYLTGVKQADIIVLAIPVGDLAVVAREIVPSIPPWAVVTDVGSTKVEVVAQLEGVFSSRFVGGHPMTGSEVSGELSSIFLKMLFMCLHLLDEQTPQLYKRSRRWLLIQVPSPVFYLRWSMTGLWPW